LPVSSITLWSSPEGSASPSLKAQVAHCFDSTLAGALLQSKVRYAGVTLVRRKSCMGAYPEHPTHQPGRIGMAVPMDEQEPHRGSLEKIATAFFKMSRS
jgi:hypothetical protein